MPTLVYIHGFLSSSASSKALTTKRWLQNDKPQWDFLCPDLPSSPQRTKECLDKLFDDPQLQREVALIGSSLGGFWATYVAERKGFPALVINPAISPQDRFRHLIGQPLKHYHSAEICVLRETDIEVMEQCDYRQLSNTDLYWLMVQTGDEVLDYTLAVERYQGCRQTVESGGDHSFQGYETWLPEIFEFFSPLVSNR